MILLVLLVVVLVIGAGAGLLGIGMLSDDRRRERSGLAAMASAPVVLAVGVALLAVMALGLVVLPSGGGNPPGESSATGGRSPRTEATQPLPSASIEPVTVTLPLLKIEVASADRFSTYRPVSGLKPGSVVRVQAEGFGWLEGGRVEQCVSELAHHTACSEAFPVQFDDSGKADFQFAVQGGFAPGGCRIGQPTCLLRLSGNDSKRQGTVQTVLVDQLTPGEVRVERSRASADAHVIAVTVTGFPASSKATAVLCAPPGAYDARRCAPPHPTSAFVIDAGGSGRTRLPVPAGRLGSDAAECGPRRPCGVAVVVGPGFVVAPVAPVAFSLGPAGAYDAGRLVLGIGGAVALLTMAVVIAVRTDWTKPTEAATPALDGADLRAARDLDELFGTDEELDRRDPIPW